MSITYHITARIYLLMSVVIFPVVCLAYWLLIVRTVRKSARSYTRWLLPGAIGATATAAGLLALSSVIFFSPENYGVAVVGNVLNIVGLLFSAVSFCRLWGVVKTLPAADDQAAKDMQHQEGVWPPPPSK